MLSSLLYPLLVQILSESFNSAFHRTCRQIDASRIMNHSLVMQPPETQKY